MNVLVLDGHGNQGVACVRSLARAGHRVILGATQPSWTAGWSRYVHERFIYPPPEDNAQAFILCLCDKLKEIGRGLVLAMMERTTLRLSEYRECVIAAGGILVLPSHEAVLKAFDKRESTSLAQSLSISVPRTVVIEPAAASELAPNMQYPVILKARMSEEPRGDGTISRTGIPLYARNDADLHWAIEKLRRTSRSILVQEFVPGRGAGYFALMNKGELCAEFAHERVRDVCPTGSGSAVRRSVLPDPHVREAGLALLRALGWTGVAMVEFRIRDDGTPVFLEVNGRFWNSLALAIYAGIDFPKLLAQMAEEGEIRERPTYRENVRCRWLLGDCRHLMDVWRGAPRGYPLAYPGRLRTLWDFIVPVPGTFHDNFQWNDPLPEFGDWFSFFLRKVPSALKATPDRPSAKTCSKV